MYIQAKTLKLSALLVRVCRELTRNHRGPIMWTVCPGHDILVERLWLDVVIVGTMHAWNGLITTYVH